MNDQRLLELAQVARPTIYGKIFALVQRFPGLDEELKNLAKKTIQFDYLYAFAYEVGIEDGFSVENLLMDGSRMRWKYDPEQNLFLRQGKACDPACYVPKNQ